MGFFACEILGRALAARGLVQVFLQPAALKNDAATANPDAGVLDLAAGHEVAERALRNREVGGGLRQGHHRWRGIPEAIDLVGLVRVGLFGRKHGASVATVGTQPTSEDYQ